MTEKNICESCGQSNFVHAYQWWFYCNNENCEKFEEGVWFPIRPQDLMKSSMTIIIHDGVNGD